MPPLLEQRPLGGLSVEVGIRRTTSRPWTWSAFFLEMNAVKSISATSATEIHLPVGSSETALGYSIVVHASSGIAAMAP